MLVFARCKSRRVAAYLEKMVKVNIDYHVQFSSHFYSVPHQLVRGQVKIRASHHTIQVLYKSKPVTSYVRKYATGGFTTKPEHMPNTIRNNNSPQSFVNLGTKAGA